MCTCTMCKLGANGGQKKAKETVSGCCEIQCRCSQLLGPLHPMPQGPNGQKIYRLHALKVSMVHDEYTGRGHIKYYIC